MSKGLASFILAVKRERETIARIGMFLTLFLFFTFYSLNLLNFPIIYASSCPSSAYCPGVGGCQNEDPVPCPNSYTVGSTCYYDLDTGCCSRTYSSPDYCGTYVNKGSSGYDICRYAAKCTIASPSCSNICTLVQGTCTSSGCGTTTTYANWDQICSNGALVTGNCGTDGWYCYDSYTKEYRDYGCSSGTCTYTSTRYSCGTTSCPSDTCVGTCGTGQDSCKYRDYPTSCSNTCSNGNCQTCTCSYTDYNADTSQTYCSGCGKTWFSTVTAGQNGNCCGDDGTSGTANDIFENRGAGNSACVEAQVVSHNNISSSQRYLVYNGEIYYCRQAGETGSPYSFVTGINPGSSIGSWKCGFDGKWRGGNIIGIRGGRIKIVA